MIPTFRFVAALLTGASAADAQVVNGNFETGVFPPWAITPTPGGGTITSGIGIYDIDGPGPLAPSNAATFMVGRTKPGTAYEGIEVSQDMNLWIGTDYSLGFHWSAHALVNVYNASAGRFELLINGAVLAQAEAPILAPGQKAYGQVTARFIVPQIGTYRLTIRITRPVLRGEEVFQYIDEVFFRRTCYANCDNSTFTPALTGNDFVCFNSAYIHGTSYANCDESTGSPLLTANDFLCFINFYAAGCS